MSEDKGPMAEQTPPADVDETTEGDQRMRSGEQMYGGYNHNPYAPVQIGPSDAMQSQIAPPDEMANPVTGEPVNVNNPAAVAAAEGDQGAEAEVEGDDSDEAPNEGTVSEVLDEVGDDPEKAAAALEAEQAEEKPRSTLVDELEPLAEDAVPDGSAGEVEKWVGSDKERAQRALDKENEGQQRKGLTNFLKGVVGAEEK